jgi:hypothetical protein
MESCKVMRSIVDALTQAATALDYSGTELIRENVRSLMLALAADAPRSVVGYPADRRDGHLNPSGRCFDLMAQVDLRRGVTPNTDGQLLTFLATIDLDTLEAGEEDKMSGSELEGNMVVSNVLDTCVVSDSDGYSL